MKPSPKAFISHASADKERFVTNFAKRLREKGIDAWLDKWELLPGDSLVEKIFEEGIKNADAFIVILSSNSINKPWVREELDAGMVRKIEKTCRLIPVIIDECVIPATLKHLVWVSVHDLTNYDDDLLKIVNTIYGVNDKPPLGTAPKHTEISIVDYLPGLTKTDNIVFRSLCRRYLEVNSKLLSLEPIYKELKAIGLTVDEINESLEILDGRGYANFEHAVGHFPEYYAIELNTSALDSFMRKELPEYNSMATLVASKIVNEGIPTNIALYDAAGISPAIVDHLLDFFELRGLIVLMKTIGATHIDSVSPELKRMLR